MRFTEHGSHRYVGRTRGDTILNNVKIRNLVQVDRSQDGTIVRRLTCNKWI